MKRMGDALGRRLAGRQYIGLCRWCWRRQAVDEGARCLDCGGLVYRLRVA